MATQLPPPPLTTTRTLRSARDQFVASLREAAGSARAAAGIALADPIQAVILADERMPLPQPARDAAVRFLAPQPGATRAPTPDEQAYRDELSSRALSVPDEEEEPARVMGTTIPTRAGPLIVEDMRSEEALLAEEERKARAIRERPIPVALPRPVSPSEAATLLALRPRG
jgi:hypothetical protein